MSDIGSLKDKLVVCGEIMEFNEGMTIFASGDISILREKLILDIDMWLDDNVNSVSLVKPIIVDDFGAKSDLVTVYGLMDIIRDIINKRFGV